MEESFTFDLSEIVEVMEEYTGAHFELTQEAEMNRIGHKELIIYVELGLSLDIFGMDAVFYNTESKRYFIFASTFLHHFKERMLEIDQSAEQNCSTPLRTKLQIA